MNDVAASSDLVAAAALTPRGGAVLVWDVTGRVFTRELLLPPPDDATRPASRRIMAQVALVPEAGLLVARHVSGQVGIWSTTSWALQGTLDFPEGTAAMAVKGTRGVFVVSGGDKRELVLVDLVTRDELARTPAPDVFSLTWSAEGTRILALAYGNTVSSFTAELTPTNEGWALPAGDQALGITASPVRPQVAIAHGPRVRIYDLPTKTEALPALEEPTGLQVTRVAWSPDGSTLAALTKPPVRELIRPGPVQLWKLDDLDWVEQICRRAGAGLSNDEWDRYIGGAANYVDRCEG